MKLIAEKKINGVYQLVVLVTPNTGNQGHFVRLLIEEGKPFWMWDTIPSGTVIAADWTDAPLVSSDPDVNNASIAAITALPEDKLTYA